MTTPHIEHAALSEYVQMAISAKEDMQTTEQQGALWNNAGHVGDLENLANNAVSAIDEVLTELRRIAGETR